MDDVFKDINSLVIVSGHLQIEPEDIVRLAIRGEIDVFVIVPPSMLVLISHSVFLDQQKVLCLKDPNYLRLPIRLRNDYSQVYRPNSHIDYLMLSRDQCIQLLHNDGLYHSAFPSGLEVKSRNRVLRKEAQCPLREHEDESVAKFPWLFTLFDRGKEKIDLSHLAGIQVQVGNLFLTKQDCYKVVRWTIDELSRYEQACIKNFDLDLTRLPKQFKRFLLLAQKIWEGTPDNEIFDAEYIKQHLIPFPDLFTSTFIAGAPSLIRKKKAAADNDEATGTWVKKTKTSSLAKSRVAHMVDLFKEHWHDYKDPDLSNETLVKLFTGKIPFDETMAKECISLMKYSVEEKRLKKMKRIKSS